MAKTLKDGKSASVTVGGGKVQPKAGLGGGVKGPGGGSSARTEPGRGEGASKQAEKRLFELAGEGEGISSLAGCDEKRLEALERRMLRTWELYKARISSADTIHTQQRAKTLFGQCLKEAVAAVEVWDAYVDSESEGNPFLDLRSIGSEVYTFERIS